MHMDTLRKLFWAIALLIVAVNVPFFSSHAYAQEIEEGGEVELLAGTTVYIDDVICGEFDPMIVGDACLARVRLADGTKLNLVAPHELSERYGYEGLKLLRGKKAVLEDANLERVLDKNALEILSDFSELSSSPQPNYYWWNGAWRVLSDDVQSSP